MNSYLKYGFTVIAATIFSLSLSAQEEFTTKINIGTGVNSAVSELSPMITPDGKYLFFIREASPDNPLVGLFPDAQDIWFSELVEGEWSPAVRMGSPFNENRYNSVEAISADGKRLYVRGKYTEDGSATKGFSVSQFIDGEGWSAPKPLEIEEFENLSLGVYSGLSVSNDERVLLLYFSEKKGSLENDIYVSFLKEDSTYTKPKKIGKPISTGDNEFAHFLAADSKTLYFASDKKDKNASGDVDIYLSRRLDDSWMKWSEPVNLGASINTAGWDTYFSIDAAGEFAYLTSNENSEGGGDIVKIELTKTQRPIPVAKVGGKFLDKETKEELSPKATYRNLGEYNRQKIALVSNTFNLLLEANVQYVVEAKLEGYAFLMDTLGFTNTDGEFEQERNFYLTKLAPDPVLTVTGYVTNAKDGRAIKADVFLDYYPSDFQNQLTISDKTTGEYELKARARERYTMRISAPGYITYKEVLPEQDKIKPSALVKNFKLQPVETMLNKIVAKVYFEPNSVAISSKYLVELQDVLQTLKMNPSYKLELAGHTDSMGEKGDNDKLSLNRSLAVYDYFARRGIDAKRIKTRAYASTRQQSNEKSNFGKQQNRRVELKFVP